MVKRGVLVGGSTTIERSHGEPGTSPEIEPNLGLRLAPLSDSRSWAPGSWATTLQMWNRFTCRDTADSAWRCPG